MKYLWALLTILVLSSLVGNGEPPKLDKSIVLMEGNGMACTGFEIQAPSGREYLISAGHCAELADDQGSIMVHTEYDAIVMRRIIAVTPNADLLLMDPVPGLKPLQVADSYWYGERIWITGHGDALPLWTVTGNIVGELPTYGFIEMFCTAPAEPGHSGSPVYGKDGYVVGVLSVRAEGSTMSGFVRLDDLKDFLKGY